MSGLLLILTGAALIFLLLTLFLNAQPAQLVRLIRSVGVIALLAVATLFLMRGSVALALSIAAAGLVWLLRGQQSPGRSQQSQTSQVRSAGLEMSLDHVSGDIDGRVLAGRFEGHLLSQLRIGDLLRVAEDFYDDAESLRLLESYLDRAHPGWREDADSGPSDGQGAAPRSGGMSQQEAYDILGLKPGASETEISAAHRRLMKQAHPDRGGSDALAARINEAKDRLLGKHR